MNAPTGLLIGGQWTQGRAGSLPVIDPATEDPIAEVASATPDDALDAVSAPYQALPGWAATPPPVRGEGLRRVSALFVPRTGPLAPLNVIGNAPGLHTPTAE